MDLENELLGDAQKYEQLAQKHQLLADKYAQAAKQLRELIADGGNSVDFGIAKDLFDERSNSEDKAVRAKRGNRKNQAADALLVKRKSATNAEICKLVQKNDPQVLAGSLHQACANAPDMFEQPTKGGPWILKNDAAEEHLIKRRNEILEYLSECPNGGPVRIHALADAKDILEDTIIFVGQQFANLLILDEPRQTIA
jgi:hypothetical protein